MIVRHVGLWVALALGCLPASGWSGVIRGELHVPARAFPSAAPASDYPGTTDALPGAHGPTRGLASDAVVYLEGLPEGSGPPTPSGAALPRLSQKGQTFVPRVLVIPRGAVVDFPNMDPIFHNVFSISPAKRFDLGKYPRGHSRQLTFNRCGLVKVYCDIHSEMEAFVLVLPHHVFARPNEAGSFALPEVDPGRYRLKVWHPDFPEITREITVPATGEPVVVSLGY